MSEQRHSYDSSSSGEHERLHKVIHSPDKEIVDEMVHPQLCC